MAKKNNIPSGFEDVLGDIYSNAENGEGVSNIDDLLPPHTPLEDEKDVPPVKTEDGKKTDDDAVNHDDDSQIPKEVVDNMNKELEDSLQSQEDVDKDDVANADLIEAQQIGLLFDAVGESLGWNMSDIDEKDRPLTVDDFTDYLAETVRQNSVPVYADERVQQLDEYIKNGGRFEDFYSIQKEGLDLNSIDIEDESNQKSVVRELLKHDGYTDDQINKRISRYEEADMLYEESEDALERLKSIRLKEADEAARAQEEYARQQEAQSREFFEAVTNDISKLDNIRGISIPKEDRKALFDYIFKVDQNGVSQYQKDFRENLSKNLIESAYFTMKADALISSAKKDGESSAADKLRKLLRHNAKNHSTFNVDQEKQKSVVDLASGLF